MPNARAAGGLCLPQAPQEANAVRSSAAAKGPVIGVAWRLRHRTGAQPAGQKHGARRLRWAGLLKLQIPVLTNLKHSKTLHRIPPRKGYVLSRNLLKSVVGATLLVASLWAGAQPAELVQAAEQGNAQAQYNLGRMLDMGDGVPQNYAEAVKWYRLAAEQGYVEAQGNLSVMLLKGNGVTSNPKQAYFWALLAAPQNQKYNELRDVLAKQLNLTERNEMQAKAAAWKPKKTE